MNPSTRGPTRILVCGLNYHPEQIGIAKYTTEMVEQLAAWGYQMRVVVAPPYYPAWRIGDGYSGWRYRRESVRGVPVTRCPIYVPAKVTGIRRVLHLASFAASSGIALCSALRWRPHLVLGIEPPLSSAPGLLACAGLARARSWLHIQDLELDAAFELGILSSPRLRGWLRCGEAALMRRFDRVSTISNPMIERVQSKGVTPARTLLLPNWVDCETIRPLSRQNPWRETLAIAPGACVALYSGNMGAKQGLELLAELAQRLAGEPDLVVVLCGEGPMRPRLEAEVRGQTNVRFLDLQPAESLNSLLNLADIHLLPQRAGVADLVMPSKLTSMLASGRPVVATAAPDTQVGRLVSRCGRVVPPGDAAALADVVLELARNPEQRRLLGAEARDQARRHFDRAAILAALRQAIDQCVQRPGPDGA